MYKIDIIGDHTVQSKLFVFILLNSHRQIVFDRDPEQKNISKNSSINNPQITVILKIFGIKNTRYSVK